MAVNRVTLQGKVGQDPELTYTPGGTPVCKFSLANSQNYKDKQGNKQAKTYWATIIAWNKLAEIISKFVVKGQEIIIEGKLSMNEWTKDGVKHRSTEIIASDMHFTAGGQPKTKDEEDDIPF